MKTLCLFGSVVFCCTATQAQETGRVLSSTPLIGQVGIPYNACTIEQVAIQQPKSGAGALIGALAGGAMGNAVGGGSGIAAATMLGAMGGAIVGDSIEATPTPLMQSLQRCSVQVRYENRTVGYRVVYEYAGRQYQAQMANDPGASIALEVTPVASAQMPAANATTVYAPAPVQPAALTVLPAYPVYTQPYYPAPLHLQFGFGYWNGFGAGHHRHWR